MSTKEQTIRTHDDLYVNEDRKDQPKEYFKWLFELTKQNSYNSSSPKILDIGCAGGDFSYFISKNIPNASVNGTDVMESLVAVAQKKVPHGNFFTANINSSDFNHLNQYDLIYMSGVHSIFDECQTWVRNYSNLLDKNGCGFVFGLFNPYPYDVLIRVRPSNTNGEYEVGWNSFSKETIKAEFDKNGCSVEFIDWSVPIDIAQNESDYLRSWTFTDNSGKRIATNATRIIHDFGCCIVKKKP